MTDESSAPDERDVSPQSGAQRARGSGREAEAARLHKNELQRRWRHQNPEKAREARLRYNASHVEQIRDEKREYARRHAAQRRAEEARKQANRDRAREWYAQNRERHIEHQRQYRERVREEKPEAYREAKRERLKRWRDGHRERENSKLRARYRDDPEAKRSRSAGYYAAHAEEVKARRRAYYAANREKQLAKQQVWRNREKRRIEAGLPAHRVHRTSRDERLVNQRAADEFFERQWTDIQIEEMRQALRTPRELINAWTRESRNERAAHHLAERAALAARVGRELGDSAKASARAAKEQEDARLDAIAREINDQLRRTPRSPSVAMDALPHASQPSTTMRGMGR